MNIISLLNRRPSLLVSTTKLTSLVIKNNRQEIETKSLLFKKRKEVSKQRISTFAALQADVNREDVTNNAVLGGGLLAGGGLSLLRGKQSANNIRTFRKPFKPGKLSGLSRISKGSVITNTLFAGLDFANRKSAGQTNLQAGLGAGGTAAGGIAGAAIGQTLIPIPVLGALIGGFVGANIGSGLADRASGVTGGDFRRLQLERESVRQSGRTEFTDGLDRFDSALDKFEKNNDDFRGFLLQKSEDDNRDIAFNPITPKIGGATQKQIDSAYSRGIGVGVGGAVSAVIGAGVIAGSALVAGKVGAFLLSGAAIAKLRGLLGLAMKSKGKIDVKVLGGSIQKIIKTPKVKITKSKVKPFPQRKILRGQDKVTSSDKKQIFQKYELNRRKKFQRNLFDTTKKEVRKKKFKSNPSDVKAEEKVLENFLKENNVQKIKSNVTQQQIQDAIKSGNIKKLQQYLDDPLNKGSNLKSDNTIFKEGDNYVVNNRSGGTTIVESEPDPYLASLNTIKAYSELTA